MCVNQFVSAGNIWKIHCCVNCGINTADMSYHNRWVKTVFTNKFNNIVHILRCASVCAGHMVLCIMNIVKIKVGTELFIKRSCKEIERTIKT